MEIPRLNYTPQPKQMHLHKSPANEILYGGSAGPGKSHALRMEAFMWCNRIPGLQVYLFRRTYPELEKNHILPSLEQFPRDVCTYKKGDKRWEFHNDSMLHFCHCQYEQNVFQYQGAEIHLLLIDELTTFTEFIYDYLRSRVRCALDVPESYRNKIPGIICASNPGGVGHNFVKERWIDFVKPMELQRAPGKEGGMVRQYIPGLLSDNAVLMRTDPEYIHRLDALPEPYRTAYKDGNWDIFMGQAFNFSRDHHVIRPIPIPQNAPIYMTYDWGFGKPFSIGWWWVDADGRLYRFAEWYGWNGMPNEGIRWEDSRVAEELIEMERGFFNNDILNYTKGPQVRLAGHDCWNKKPDYKGGGQGKSTAEVFAEKGIYLTKGDSSRDLKIRQFRERLRIREGEMPMLVVYSTCEQFIRTVTTIQTDPKNVEYIDDTGECHTFDDACHICMARPMPLKEPKKIKTMAELRIDYLEKGTHEDQFHAQMAKEEDGYDREFERMMRDRFGERTEQVDAYTINTVDD
jgi:hypothetical protein